MQLTGRFAEAVRRNVPAVPDRSNLRAASLRAPITLNINARSLASRSLPIAAGFAFGPTPARHASAAPKMLAEKGPESEASPAPGRPIIISGVGHHSRQGGHSVEAFDWAKFTEFAEYHLMGEGRP